MRNENKQIKSIYLLSFINYYNFNSTYIDNSSIEDEKETERKAIKLK